MRRVIIERIEGTRVAGLTDPEAGLFGAWQPRDHRGAQFVTSQEPGPGASS